MWSSLVYKVRHSFFKTHTAWGVVVSHSACQAKWLTKNSHADSQQNQWMEPSKVIWTINALGRMTNKRSSRQWHNVSTTSPKHIHPEFSELLYLIINEPQGQLRSTEVCRIRLFVSTNSEAHWPKNSANACTLSSTSRKARWGTLEFSELDNLHPQVFRNILIQKLSECAYLAINEPQGQLTSTEVCRIRLYFIINEPQGQLSFTEVCRIRIFFATSPQKHIYPEILRMSVLRHQRASMRKGNNAFRHEGKKQFKLRAVETTKEIILGRQENATNRQLPDVNECIGSPQCKRSELRKNKSTLQVLKNITAHSYGHA